MDNRLKTFLERHYPIDEEGYCRCKFMEGKYYTESNKNIHKLMVYLVGVLGQDYYTPINKWLDSFDHQFAYVEFHGYEIWMKGDVFHRPGKKPAVINPIFTAWYIDGKVLSEIRGEGHKRIYYDDEGNIINGPNG